MTRTLYVVAATRWSKDRKWGVISSSRTLSSNHFIVIPQAYRNVMKVVAQCVKEGGRVCFRSRRATKKEQDRRWITAAEINLHWSEN